MAASCRSPSTDMSSTPSMLVWCIGKTFSLEREALGYWNTWNNGEKDKQAHDTWAHGLISYQKHAPFHSFVLQLWKRKLIRHRSAPYFYSHYSIPVPTYLRSLARNHTAHSLLLLQSQSLTFTTVRDRSMQGYSIFTEIALAGAGHQLPAVLGWTGITRCTHDCE